MAKTKEEPKNKGGRPRKEIDFDALRKLCSFQCTGEECAQFFDMDYDTLNSRVKEKYGYGFSEFFKLKRGLGRISLRRKQWEVAMSGDKSLLIFLGKNYLDQSDKKEIITNDGFEHMENDEITEKINRITGLLKGDNGKGNGNGNGNGGNPRTAAKSRRTVGSHKGNGVTPKQS